MKMDPVKSLDARRLMTDILAAIDAVCYTAGLSDRYLGPGYPGSGIRGVSEQLWELLDHKDESVRWRVGRAVVRLEAYGIAQATYYEALDWRDARIKKLEAALCKLDPDRRFGCDYEALMEQSAEEHATKERLTAVRAELKAGREKDMAEGAEGST